MVQVPVFSRLAVDPETVQTVGLVGPTGLMVMVYFVGWTMNVCPVMSPQ